MVTSGTTLVSTNGVNVAVAALVVPPSNQAGVKLIIFNASGAGTSGIAAWWSLSPNLSNPCPIPGSPSAFTPPWDIPAPCTVYIFQTSGNDVSLWLGVGP